MVAMVERAVGIQNHHCVELRVDLYPVGPDLVDLRSSPEVLASLANRLTRSDAAATASGGRFNASRLAVPSGLASPITLRSSTPVRSGAGVLGVDGDGEAAQPGRRARG